MGYKFVVYLLLLPPPHLNLFFVCLHTHIFTETEKAFDIFEREISLSLSLSAAVLAKRERDAKKEKHSFFSKIFRSFTILYASAFISFKTARSTHTHTHTQTYVKEPGEIWEVVFPSKPEVVLTAIIRTQDGRNYKEMNKDTPPFDILWPKKKKKRLTP